MSDSKEKALVVKSSIAKNILMSVIVQIVSMAVSFLFNLVVPKYISELQYAHWQTYVLYVSYVGVLHFGLLDGLVLRYSQYNYDELDKPRIRSQFKILLSINTIMALVTLLITTLLAKEAMWWIFLFVSIGIVSKNLFTYTSYTFQLTNRISKYAILTISQRMAFGFFIVLMLALRVQQFQYYCLAEVFGDVIGCGIGYLYNKELYFGKSIPLRDAVNELFVNISSGIRLLIANWSSMLLVGSAKMIIQWHWDELTFGKVSFSFSLTNLFLTFVTAISVVLFPSLKRMEKDKLPQLYMSIRNAISPILFVAMLFYYPGCLLLDMWLPKYHESLAYLGILMPIIIYTSKISLLTNNYLKAYREEQKMLVINVISVVIAIGCFAFSAYVINSLTLLLMMIVMTIMMRSIISEVVVMKLIHVQMIRDFIIEAIMTVVFIICAKLMTFWIGFAVYAVFLVIYCIIYRKNLMSYFRKMRRIV